MIVLIRPPTPEVRANIGRETILSLEITVSGWGRINAAWLCWQHVSPSPFLFTSFSPGDKSVT